MRIALGRTGNRGATGWLTPFDESHLPSVGGRVTVAGTEAAPRHPPRLLVRSLYVSFATVLAILLAVFVVLVLDLRARVQTEVADNLETGDRLLSAIEQRRTADVRERVTTLTHNPTFEAAVEKYANEFGGFSPLQIRQSMVWLEGELQTLAETAGADVAAVIDRRNLTMARAGRLGANWPAHVDLASSSRGTPAEADLLTVGPVSYRTTSLPLRVNGQQVGILCLARSLDSHLASYVSTITRAESAFFVNHALVASTLSPAGARALAAAWRAPIPERGELRAGGETYAFRRLEAVKTAETYALASVSAPASRTTAKAFRALALVGLGSLVLAVLGSSFLAHTLAGPIDGISQSLSAAVHSKDLGIRLKPDGSSHEVEVLAESFNELMGSLSRAEEETRSAYLGAIRALANALEARDVYTSGHSERVSDLSVRIGKRMGMSEHEIDVLRMGASLHDIGKIGVGDDLLRKPGPLTDGERTTIEAHTRLGARILEPVGFLADHLPIVELHHEQPDGRGYPNGLACDRIPLSARIVHLADAYDAMTSDRPYRPGCSPRQAVLEILRCRGSQFDDSVVDAFLAVMRESDPASAEVTPPAAARLRRGQTISLATQQSAGCADVDIPA